MSRTGDHGAMVEKMRLESGNVAGIKLSGFGSTEQGGLGPKFESGRSDIRSKLYPGAKIFFDQFLHDK